MRVGVYGGTFDPVHVGHLIVAGDAFESLRLDRLLFVPSAVHPLKRDRVRTPAVVRTEMLRAAIAGDERFEVDEVELSRPGVSYTVDTLRVLRRRWPDAELYLLVGADVVPELPAWREPGEIAALATVAVMTRGGENAGSGATLPVLSVPVTRVDVSSTTIRRRTAEGLSLRHWVPEAVREIIARESLYRRPAHIDA